MKELLKKIAAGEDASVPTGELSLLLLHTLSPFYFAGVDENLPCGVTEGQIIAALRGLLSRDDFGEKEEGERLLASLLSRETAPSHTFYSEEMQMLSHVTHGVYFGIAAEEGELKLSFRHSGEEAVGFASFGDPACRAGSVVREGRVSKGVGSGTPVFAQRDGYAVFSLWLDRDGISGRETVFCFEGGICVLGCDFWDEKEDSVLIANVNHCFADREKMKIHEHSVTQGAFIYRSLFDDIPFRKHIRPQAEKCAGGGESEGEKRNLFTIYQIIPNEFPCFAYEVTNIGMAHAVEVLENGPARQAIMLDGGAILSFEPESGRLCVL